MKLRSIILSLLFVAFTLISYSAAAESSGQLKVKVVDADSLDFAIIGAVVELRAAFDNPYSLYYSTDGDGLVTIPKLRYGRYSLRVSFLGYEEKTVDFTINTPDLELNQIALRPTSLKLDEVVKEIKSLRTSQNGDSLQYSASAYKVAADADVEGLLQKMPGITVEDGKVTAQGENIKKIYIDGREFFGNDVATAIKTLPAEVVDKIELYNKLSDDAEASGVDDGKSEKTINIVTKSNMREGLFGKLFAGVGYEPEPPTEASTIKYMGGGSLNIFKGKSRTSIIALVNNLNQQNFSFEDIMGATDEGGSTGEFTIKALPGVASVNAVGINYSNELGSESQVKLQGSYFLNQTTTSNTEEIMRWYAEPATQTIDSLWQEAKTRTENINNRLTGRIDIKLSDRQSIMIRPTLSIQSTNPYRSAEGIRYDDNNFNSYEDGMQHYANSKSSQWGGYNVGAYASYRIRLGDNGRLISVMLNASKNSFDTDAQTTTEPNTPNIYHKETTYTLESSPTAKHSFTGSINYLEPLSKRLKLNISYKRSNSEQESNKRTFGTGSDFEVEDYDIARTTNYAKSLLTTNTIGAGLRYGKKKLYVTTSFAYLGSTFDVNTLRSKAGSSREDKTDITKNYDDFTYSVVANLGINPENTLRFYVVRYTSTPVVNKFTDNTSSSSFVTAGNSNLDPSQNNQLRLFYTHTDLERGSTLMFNCNALITKDYIGSHVIYDPGAIMIGDKLYDNLQSYTTWVNLDSFYKLDSNVSFGMPIDFLKCNLNFNSGVSYQQTPSLYGGEVVEMGEVSGGERMDRESMTYRAGATLGSNISENVDFTIAWRGNYNQATNHYKGAAYDDNYFTQTASINLKTVFWGGFTLTSNLAYRQYRGITNNYCDSYTLLNAFIGHKIMHKKRGEITIGVNDILDQNTAINRNISNTSTERKINTTLGRYVSVQFIYNLRSFNKAKNKKHK